MVSGSDHYCAVIGQDVLGEMFTSTIGQLIGWEEGILLIRSLDDFMKKSCNVWLG